MSASEPSYTFKKSGEKLKSYQAKDLERLVKREKSENIPGVNSNVGTLLAYQMGLGKTPVAIALICAHPLSGPTLVICPNKAMIDQWVGEVAKFAPELKVAIHHGPKRSKDPRVFADRHVVITTYNLLWRQYKALQADLQRLRRDDYPMWNGMKWCRVILDESQNMKNSATLTAAACCALVKDHGLLLSATPAQNALEEDLKSTWRFLNVPLSVRSSDGETLSYARLSEYFIRRKTDVLHDLPGLHEHTINLRLTPVEQSVYDFVTAMRYHSLARMTRQSQVTSHPALIKGSLRQRGVSEQTLGGEEGPFDVGFESTKIQAVMEVLEEIRRRPGNEKTIVFCRFLLTLDILFDLLETRGYGCTLYNGEIGAAAQNAALAEIATDPRRTVLLMSIGAGGAGLNITSCNNVIITEPNWNPYREEQAVGRAHRIGQTKDVHVYSLVAEQTIDRRITEVQTKKRNKIDPYMERMTAMTR